MDCCQIETCLNNTLSKPESWIKQNCNKVPMKEIFCTARYVAWGEYSVLSKNVSRDVRKDIIWSHIIKCNKVCQWLAAGRFLEYNKIVIKSQWRKFFVTNDLFKLNTCLFPTHKLVTRRFSLDGCSLSVYCSFLQHYRPPRYNWNIIESGIKHHTPNPQFYRL
jgi:hypothetical protein